MHFEIFLGADTRWYWRLQGPDGETIADCGRGYWDRRDAERGVALVRQATDAPVHWARPSTVRPAALAGEDAGIS